MSRARESCARESRGRERDTTPLVFKKLMPPLGPLGITTENLFSSDRGLSVIASGPLSEDESGGGAVDLSLIVKHGGSYQYHHLRGYPKYFPLNEYLFPFIQNFILVDIDEDDVRLPAERYQLERAILIGQDTMFGSWWDFLSVATKKMSLQ